MTFLIGILGAGALFTLFAFSASRPGARLEAREGCQGRGEALGACSLQDECEGCGHEKAASGWWPGGGVTYGDRR